LKRLDDVFGAGHKNRRAALGVAARDFLKKKK
jgi:hypothetical protein